MSIPEPAPRGPRPGDLYGDLTWASIAYGAVVGTFFAMLALKWGCEPIENITQVGFVMAMLVHSGLSFAQLRIGIGLLQQQRWAVFACLYTNLALLIFSVLGVGVSALYLSIAVVPQLFVVTWSFWALWILRDSDFAHELRDRQE
jgi:hypothetical protein